MHSFSVQSQSLRVFFFNTTDKGARFRLQCSSDTSNRCSASAFQAKGQELCEQANLKLTLVSPFSCIDREAGQVILCKYANGECIKAAEDEEVEVEIRDTRSLEASKLPDVRKLPSVRELPSSHDLPRVKDLPQVKDLPPVKPIR